MIQRLTNKIVKSGAIVQRAEASSRLQVLRSPNENQRYRYGGASEISPCSVKSWKNNDVVSTPSSYTKSRSNSVISPLGVNSSTLDLEARRLPARKVLEKHQTDVSPLNSSSFRFGCKPTFLNSIDLNCFINSRFNELLKAEKKKDKSSASDVGISWREGLLSRISETGDLDSYQSFFVDNECYDYSRDGDESSCENGSSIFEKEMGLDHTIFRSRITKSVIKGVNQKFLLCVPIKLLSQLAKMVFSSLLVTPTGFSLLRTIYLKFECISLLPTQNAMRLTLSAVLEVVHHMARRKTNRRWSHQKAAGDIR
ncbi:hypothetical protein KSP40_PGU020128 [Platanthera guangdongensis]|uniref:Uncharacterized protein n=1 Tax=Platanthera guangdongensis TaxID=2320717 RepID=A0ABR2N2F7_9ASPA